MNRSSGAGMGSGWLGLGLGWVLGVALGCNDRVVGPEQPPAPGPGDAYSGCLIADDCGIQDGQCLRPVGETGFCTEDCVDASTCPGGEGLEPACIVAGDPPRSVCALECSAVPCPEGMRCEAVEIEGAGRQICF